MIKYCLLTVDYEEHYANPIPYDELDVHLEDAEGKVDLRVYESGKTDNIEDTWNMEVDSDLDLYELDEAEIYSDDDIAVYLLSTLTSSQSMDMHYADPAEEYIDCYTGSGSVLVANYKNRSEADLLAYVKQKISADEFAADIVQGDIAGTITY